MRNIAFASLLLTIGSFGYAHGVRSIDLDQPGVLDQLKALHPARYQAVTALLRASEHAPCLGGEIEIVKTRYDVKDLECGMVVFTSYPAKRHVNFKLDGVNYAATVLLKDPDVVMPISPAIDRR